MSPAEITHRWAERAFAIQLAGFVMAGLGVPLAKFFPIAGAVLASFALVLTAIAVTILIRKVRV